MKALEKIYIMPGTESMKYVNKCVSLTHSMQTWIISKIYFQMENF